LILSNINLSNCEIGSRHGGAITKAGLGCQASYGQKLQAWLNNAVCAGLPRCFV
jgi:hypothetical protein